MKYLKAIKIVGILIFIYILSLLDYRLVVESILNLNLVYILVYAVLWYLFFFVKVYRWHVIQNYFIFTKKLSFQENFFVYVETIYLSYVTPGKIGDIARLWIMKENYGIDKKDSFVAYIFDRIQDLYFLVLFSLFSLLFVIELDVPKYVYILFMMFLIFYIFKNFFINQIQKISQYMQKIKTDFLFEIKIFFINLSAFFIYFSQVYILAKAMNLNIDFLFIVAVVSISAIATLIPLSISGLGVREGIFIFLLASVGVGKEDAVVLSLLDNVVFVALFIVLLQLFSKFYLRKKVIKEGELK